MPAKRKANAPLAHLLRRVGGCVLDPVCGSGTTAVAALRLGRRFIAIDRNPDAIEVVEERLYRGKAKNEFPPVDALCGGRQMRINIIKDWGETKSEPLDCFLDDCWVICGDALAVLRAIPDSCVELVYADPPFNTGKNFRDKKTGMGFSDIWVWDDAAEGRMTELRELDPASTEQSSEGVIDIIEFAKKYGGGGALGSYLSWVALLLIECRRVMGSYEWEPEETPVLWTPS